VSVFADLLLEAKLHGAERIEFSVDLAGYVGVPDRQRWTARATLASHEPNVPHLAIGRAGEEALRELVNYLKATTGG
jgi:hypothetical protein